MAVKARFESPKSASAPPAKPEKPASAARPIVPTTLSNVPSAGMNTEGGEFDYMDNLNGLAYEAALSKMPNDQHNRFLMN